MKTFESEEHLLITLTLIERAFEYTDFSVDSYDINNLRDVVKEFFKLRKQVEQKDAALQQGIRLADHYLERHSSKDSNGFRALPCDWFEEAKDQMQAALTKDLKETSKVEKVKKYLKK